MTIRECEHVSPVEIALATFVSVVPALPVGIRWSVRLSL